MADKTGKSEVEVAMELARQIFSHENSSTGGKINEIKEKPREYWFNLYTESLEIVSGGKSNK